MLASWLRRPEGSLKIALLEVYKDVTELLLLTENQRSRFWNRCSEQLSTLSVSQGILIAFWPAQSRITIKHDGASALRRPFLAIWFLFLDIQQRTILATYCSRRII